MARKRYTFRKSLGRYRYSSKRWRTFSRYNYNNLKLECNFHIQYPSSNGDPIMYFGPNVQAKFYTMADIFAKSDWTTFKPLYQMYKLKGLRFECTPMPCNAGNENVTQSSAVWLGWALSQVGDASENTQWLTTSDRSMVLNPLAKTVKYFSTWGAQDDWKLTSTNLLGNVCVYSDEKSTLNAGPVWHCKLTLYVVVKMANK